MKRDTIFSGVAILAMVFFATLSVPGLAVQADHGGEAETHAPQSSHETEEGNAHGDAGGEYHEDLGQQRAGALAVHEAPSWYPKVIGAVVILFVLAMTLGSFAIVAKGPEPPDPADSHH